MRLYRLPCCEVPRSEPSPSRRSAGRGLPAPGSSTGRGRLPRMISTVRVIGTGRAGGTIAARLAERGLAVKSGREALADADLVLLAVPDGAIAGVAGQVPIGPWVAHVSGATSLRALDPHARRF